jgi:tetratricopeptide (TPR) repeat protein
MPTVLDALGIESPGPVQGRSLLPLLFTEPEDREELPMIMETIYPWQEYGWSPSRAVRTSGFKYIQAPRPELYDLDSDPREMNNVHEQNRGRSEEMARLLKRNRREYEAGSISSHAALEIDDETKQRLFSLGYVFTGAGAGEPSLTAPDAKDMVDVLVMEGEAMAFRKQGRMEEAVAVLEGALEKSPENRRAMNLLGAWYILMGRYDEAKKVLESLLELDPDFIDAYLNLALAYFYLEQLEKARLTADNIIARNPKDAKAQKLIGAILLKQTRYEESLPYFKKSIELAPFNHETHFNLGLSYQGLGMKDKALNSYARAVELDPDNQKYRQFMEAAARALH